MTSNPKFIEPILDAIVKLAERNGSSAKDILNYVWKSDKSTVKRNLTLQVRKALKQAVVQGLIRLRGGRYKAYPSCPIKKPGRAKKVAVEKGKNCSVTLPATQSKRQARRNKKISKCPKQSTKVNQPDSKSHAAQKPSKARKRPKPSAK